MGLIDRLAAQAEAHCTMTTGDRVTLAGSDTAGTITEDGGYGYFKVTVDGSRCPVIRHFTELALTPGA